MHDDAFSEIAAIISSTTAEVINSLHFTTMTLGGAAWGASYSDSNGPPESPPQGMPSFPRVLTPDGLKTFVEEQHEQGYPYLHRLTIVWLCALTDSMVFDLASALLARDPSIRSREQIRKLQGPLVEFLELDEEQRAEHVATLLEQSLRENLYGFKRHEALLGAVGVVSAPIPKVMEKTLLEMTNTRNAIVHRRGRVDRRLQRACPWMDWRTGQELIVSRELWDLYANGVMWYATSLEDRLRATYGRTATPSGANFRAELLKDQEETFYRRANVRPATP